MSKYVGFKIGKVHESHVISEYYCGGCGWPVTDHDNFCPECGGAFRKCDASNLEDENANLKRRLEILKSHGIEIVDAIAGGFEIYNKEHARADRLKSENAWLREMLSESHQANERLYAELKRYKKIFRTRPIAMNILFDENNKLRELCIDLAEHLLEAERIHGDNLLPDGYKRRMSELGIEVEA